jgi:nucleoid-associated protein YgaU
MGLFGKSDKEKEREEQAKHQEAQRKMQEALRRRQQEEAAKAAPKPAAAPAPAAKPGAPAAGGPQAVPVSQPAAGAGQSYTVQKGDSLSKIAKKHLGDANAWKKIYEANRATIGDDPDLIKPGQKLQIPGGGGKLA